MKSNPFLPRGNIERQSLIGGIVGLLLGLATICVGCGLLILKRDDWIAWIGSLVMVLLGLFFATVFGDGMLFRPILRRRKRQRILNLGTAITAKVTEIRKEDDESPFWIIVAKVADKSLGRDGLVTSHAFGNDPRTNDWWQNPRKDYPIGSEITVRYLPGDPCTYAFDLMDRLDGPRHLRKPMPISVREAWTKDFRKNCARFTRF